MVGSNEVTALTLWRIVLNHPFLRYLRQQAPNGVFHVLRLVLLRARDLRANRMGLP